MDKILRKIISGILWSMGLLFLLIALINGGSAITSLLERLQHGSGLMFAEVEFFLLIFVFTVLLGILCIFGARKIPS
jgi:hypothetical protein